MLVDADVLQFPVAELTQHDQCRFAFVARDHARDPTVDKAAYQGSRPSREDRCARRGLDSASSHDDFLESFQFRRLGHLPIHQ